MRWWCSLGFKRVFLALGLSFGLMACSLFDGPYERFAISNEEDTNFDFNPGNLVSWVDGDSLYNRGLMRLIVEDVGDENSKKTFIEKTRRKMASTQLRKSITEPVLIYGFDWYAEPLKRARLIFEVGVPDGRPGHSSSFASGYSTTIGLRLMLPAPDGLTSYDAVRVKTSARHHTLHEATLRRADFTEGNFPEHYLRFETLAGKNRLDILFPSKIHSSYHIGIRDDLLWPSMTSWGRKWRLLNDSSPYITGDLIGANAFGLPQGADGPALDPGDLHFEILDASGDLLVDYQLSKEQIGYLREIFRGNTLEANYFARTYYSTHSYAHTVGESTVTRYRDGASPCVFKLKATNWNTSYTGDDTYGIESEYCDSGRGNTWDQPLESISTALFLPQANEGRFHVHLPKHFIKPEFLDYTFYFGRNNFGMSFDKNMLDLGALGEGGTLMYIWGALFKKDSTLNGLRTVWGGSVSAEQTNVAPNTFAVTFFPDVEDLVSSGTRIAPLYFWWPGVELQKMRLAFNP